MHMMTIAKIRGARQSDVDESKSPMTIPGSLAEAFLKVFPSSPNLNYNSLPTPIVASPPDRTGRVLRAFISQSYHESEKPDTCLKKQLSMLEANILLSLRLGNCLRSPDHQLCSQPVSRTDCGMKDSNNSYTYRDPLAAGQSPLSRREMQAFWLFRLKLTCVVCH
jgi:hypothetical protein